jgi:uncharacterized membrane protein
MKKLHFYTLLLTTILIISCTNDSESDLINPTPVAITYTNEIKSVIDNNCTFCHGNIPTNGAPMSLTTYLLVKDAINNRGLIDRISRVQGAQGMMPNGGTRLPQNTINSISQWKNEGFIE